MTLGYSIAPVQHGLAVQPRYNRFAPPPRFAPPAAPPPPRRVWPSPQRGWPAPQRGWPSGNNSAWQARRANFQQQEFERLLRMNRELSREQAALMAQQAAMQQVPATPPPSAPMQVPSSPAAPGGDMTPAQDASDGGGAGGEEAPSGGHPHNKHLVLFLGIAAAAGVGGYIFLKKKKSKP